MLLGLFPFPLRSHFSQRFRFVSVCHDGTSSFFFRLFRAIVLAIVPRKIVSFGDPRRFRTLFRRSHDGGNRAVGKNRARRGVSGISADALTIGMRSPAPQTLNPGSQLYPPPRPPRTSLTRLCGCAPTVIKIWRRKTSNNVDSAGEYFPVCSVSPSFTQGVSESLCIVCVGTVASLRPVTHANLLLYVTPPDKRMPKGGLEDGA